jgi:hypothetical protein
MVRSLGRKLVADGNLYVREPHYGLAQDEVRRLMQRNGLTEF